ncbi:MAG: hypothetical protein OQK29_01325 [Ignavibacteriaceae bacterium]|nr:hypothetical protein [Ignavibacteriaceae bacterium]
MSKNSVQKTCELIYPAELARRLDVTDGAVRKAMRKNYFPSDWFQRIKILTNNAVSYDELYHDLYLHKYGIIPEVLLNGIGKFPKPCQQCRQRVRKHRQKAAS